MLTNAQTVNDAIKQVADLHDAGVRWAYSKDLVNHHKSEIKRAVEQAIEVERAGQTVRPAIDPNLSDAEIRKLLRVHLIERLADGSLTAAEIAQLKDVFDLSKAAEAMVIELVEYSGSPGLCPHCGLDPYQPVIPKPGEPSIEPPSIPAPMTIKS